MMNMTKRIKRAIPGSSKGSNVEKILPATRMIPPDPMVIRKKIMSRTEAKFFMVCSPFTSKGLIESFTYNKCV